MSENSRVPRVDYKKANNPKCKAKSPDPSWKYRYWPEENHEKVMCILCGNPNTGGISRLKKHLIGGCGEVVK